MITFRLQDVREVGPLLRPKTTIKCVMAAELYKEEDSRVYNIGVFSKPLLMDRYERLAGSEAWSYSKTARFHKR